MADGREIIRRRVGHFLKVATFVCRSAMRTVVKKERRHDKDFATLLSLVEKDLLSVVLV